MDPWILVSIGYFLFLCILAGAGAVLAELLGGRWDYAVTAVFASGVVIYAVSTMHRWVLWARMEVED